MRFTVAKYISFVFLISMLAMPRSADAEEAWSFSLAPFAWLSGVSGEVATLPPLPPVDIDASFSDIVSDLDGALFLMGEARKGRLFFLGEIMYSSLEGSGQFRSGGFVTARGEQDIFIIDGVAGYTVLEQKDFNLDVFGGARYWSLDTKMTLSGPLNSVSNSDEKDWVDPIIGARLDVPLGDSWQVILTSDIGGFGLGSDLEWEIIGTVQYKINDWCWIGAGYRYLSIDYQDGGFIYDVDQGGPILGAAFKF